MPEPKIRRTLVQARDTLHLLGGVRAGTHSNGHLVIFPSRKKAAIGVPSVAATQNYWSTIKAFGLDLIGDETETKENGIHHHQWHLFEEGTPTLESALVTWGHIAYSAHQNHDDAAANLARDIAFSLRAANVRLRDISRAYGWQNNYAVLSGLTPGRHFANLELFDLYLALHSFLAEASSARDYLARYIASKMVNLTEVDSMAKLQARLRKGTSVEGAIAQEILKICDRTSPAGWMACLSEFRNLVLHRSPIARWSEKIYLVVNALKVGEEEVLTVYLGLLAIRSTTRVVISLTHSRTSETSCCYCFGLRHVLRVRRPSARKCRR